MMRILTIVSCFILSIQMYAQDPQFSHLYANPLYLGPSFAGATGGSRVTLNARDQWTAVAKEYISYSASIDHYFYGTNSGGGLMLFRDHAGDGKLTTHAALLQYSYSINAGKNFSIRPGIQFTYAQRKIDYSELTFGDQISIEEIKDYTIEPQLEESITYIDFSGSLMGIYKNHWFGFTLDHIAQPNHSLTARKVQIPIRKAFYIGSKFHINTRIGKKRVSELLYVMAHFNQQDNFNQAFLGTYYTRQQYIFGLWYRGIPFLKTYEDYKNNDACIFMVGFRKHNLTFLYSYDFTISKLISDSAGSHEITVTINWKSDRSKRSKKNMKVVPCPMQEPAWKKYDSQTM
ncbi:MAG: PorP/SprF family type IX secretion system membrane protein [Bacteroidales bacterium]